jgi:hypothetical protein
VDVCGDSPHVAVLYDVRAAQRFEKGDALRRTSVEEHFFQKRRKKNESNVRCTSKTGKLANFEGVKSAAPAGDLMGFNSEAMRGGLIT